MFESFAPAASGLIYRHCRHRIPLLMSSFLFLSIHQKQSWCHSTSLCQFKLQTVCFVLNCRHNIIVMTSRSEAWSNYLMAGHAGAILVWRHNVISDWLLVNTSVVTASWIPRRWSLFCHDHSATIEIAVETNVSGTGCRCDRSATKGTSTGCRRQGRRPAKCTGTDCCGNGRCPTERVVVGDMVRLALLLKLEAFRIQPVGKAALALWWQQPVRTGERHSTVLTWNQSKIVTIYKLMFKLLKGWKLLWNLFENLIFNLPKQTYESWKQVVWHMDNFLYWLFFFS